MGAAVCEIVASVIFERGAAEVFAEVGGAGDVSFARFEVGLAELLQVGGLGVDEEFVDAGNLQILDESEVDPHAEA